MLERFGRLDLKMLAHFLGPILTTLSDYRKDDIME